MTIEKSFMVRTEDVVGTLLKAQEKLKRTEHDEIPTVLLNI